MRVFERTSPRSNPIRHGAAAVEFAVVFPVLMTIVLACVDFGRFAHSYIAVTNAARAGAGKGSVNAFTTATLGTWKAQIQQAVQEEIERLNDFDPAQLSVVVDDPVWESDGLWRVRVDVSYPFRMVVNWPGIPNQVTLRHVVVMRGIR